MSYPTISVVMSVFNGECFLREAMDSILAQSFRDFEFIVINDGSSDSSGSILDWYQTQDARVRVYHQENCGLVESLNRGCVLARGRYIARMDADDVTVRSRLQWQFDFMEEHPEVGVLGGAVEIINVNGKSIATHYCLKTDHAIRKALLRGDNPLWHPAVFLRKAVIEAAGGYRKGALDAEDYDLWLRVAERCEFANLDKIVLKYRRHPAQVSVNKCKQQAISNLAARAARSLRLAGLPDPLDSANEITPRVLDELGLNCAGQRTVVARSYLTCIQSMLDAGEDSLASEVMTKMASCGDWRYLESNLIADHWLLAARVFWRERRVNKSFLAASRALLSRPIILGRPLKQLLRWLRLVNT
jgi:Glycosyl transferase family 2